MSEDRGELTEEGNGASEDRGGLAEEGCEYGIGFAEER